MKLLDDIKAYSGKSLFKVLYTVFLNSNFQMIFWYRVAHLFYRIHFSFISKIIMYFHKLIFSCDIDYRCVVGGGIKIVHGLGIVIGCGVTVGRNVTLYKGVTLGGNLGKYREINGKKKYFPHIGDNVQMLTNSAVYGPCNIGDSCIIAANVTVTKDVPDKTFVYNEVNQKFKEVEN